MVVSWPFSSMITSFLLLSSIFFGQTFVSSVFSFLCVSTVGLMVDWAFDWLVGRADFFFFFFFFFECSSTKPVVHNNKKQQATVARLFRDTNPLSVKT